jgi:hypothetical protein
LMTQPLRIFHGRLVLIRTKLTSIFRGTLLDRDCGDDRPELQLNSTSSGP